MLMTGKYAFTFVQNHNFLTQLYAAINTIFVYFQFDIFNNVVVDSTFKANDNKCKLTFAKNSINFFAPMCYGYTKNGPYSKAFDEL